MSGSIESTKQRLTVYTDPETLTAARRDLGIVLSDLALRDDGFFVVICNERPRSLKRLMISKWQIDVIPVSEAEDWNLGEELEGLTARCAQFPESIDETARAALYKACAAGAKRIPGDEALAIIRGN